jgi:hypothetical protein
MGGMNALNTNALNSNDWLSQLAADHAPPAVGWWPLAPGWWALMLLLLLAVAGFLYWYYQPAHRLRRTALRELKHIENTHSGDASDNTHELAHELENLMRRYALARFGREAVAGLSGENWLTFIITHSGTTFYDNTGADLLRAAYGGKPATEPLQYKQWLSGARAFIQERP